MFVFRKALPRRTFLRGVGAAVALPFLEAMVPALTVLAQSGARPPLRFGAVYVPNGATMKHWMPPTSGTGLEFTPILKPLEPYREYLNVYGNLSRAGGTSVTDHAVSSAGWLSGAVAKQTEAEDVRVGITLDQVLAQQVGQDTAFPSLELATEDFAGYVGGCVPGYACTYMNTICWASETQPLPMEINPRVVFERMFGRPGTAAERAARRSEDRSILDSVREEAVRLQRRVSSQDRARLDSYLDHVREIERRIQLAEAQNRTSVIAVDAPLGVPESFEEHLRLMFRLLAIAYQADLTRVFTFMTAREASQRTYPQLDIRQPHHDVSHHANQAANMETFAKINTYYASLFAEFVETLRTSPEGDGSVLEHSLVFYGGGMSDGQAHSPYPLPLVSVGRAGGRLKGDRMMTAPEWTSVANLWLSVAGIFGSPLERFGESTGRVDL
jgi:hypothetical protein